MGEIPLELQSKLLRVLQEREFERLGSSRTIRTEGRVSGPRGAATALGMKRTTLQARKRKLGINPRAPMKS